MYILYTLSSSVIMQNMYYCFGHNKMLIMLHGISHVDMSLLVMHKMAQAVMGCPYCRPLSYVDMCSLFYTAIADVCNLSRRGYVTRRCTFTSSHYNMCNTWKLLKESAKTVLGHCAGSVKGAWIDGPRAEHVSGPVGFEIRHVSAKLRSLDQKGLGLK